MIGVYTNLKSGKGVKSGRFIDEQNVRAELISVVVKYLEKSFSEGGQELPD